MGLTSKERWLAVLVLVGAILAHVPPWLQYAADPFAKTLVADALSYDGWARQIASDGVGTQPVFHQAPLFPVALSWVHSHASGAAQWDWAIAFQVLLTSLALAGLVPLAKHFLDSAAAGVAGAAVAVLHGPFVFHSLKLLPVALALATQVGALLTLALARRRASAWAALAAGAALGVAALARAEVLLFVPVAAVAVAVAHPRRRSLLTLCLLGGVLVGLAPATVHNLRQGDFVLVASSGGENLYIGNKRGAEGDYTPIHPKAGDLFSERLLATQLAEADLGPNPRPSKVSSYWRRRALSEIAADPGAWLRLEAKKLGRIFAPGDPNDIYSFPLERSQYLSSLWILSLPAWTVLGAGGWGLLLALRRVRSAAWPLAAFVGVLTLILLLFFVNTRLRLPLLFFLTPFAGLALLELPRLRRSASVVGIALIAALTLVGLARTAAAPRDFLRLASILSRQGRLDEGLAVLGPVLSRVPPYALAFDEAGWLLQKKGDFAGAAKRYREALDAGLAAGRAAQTRTRLAVVLEQIGDLAGAAAEHDRAASDPQANAGTYYERALFRLRRSDRDGSVADLRTALRLDPGWPPPKEMLARLR